jgi:hypothetical protein
MAEYLPDDIKVEETAMYDSDKVYVDFLDCEEGENIIGLVKYIDPNTTDVIARYDVFESICRLCSVKKLELTFKEEWEDFYSWVKKSGINVVFTRKVAEYFNPDNDYNPLGDEDY